MAAAAGRSHSAAVTEDGALWTWGYGGNGQLGHGDEEDHLVPTLVLGAGLGGRRIGRCRGLPEDHAVAFAIGTHARLGAASPVRCLAGEVELLRMIVGWAVKGLGGEAGRKEGLVRLAGGGRILAGYVTYKLQGRLEIGEAASVLARPNKDFKLQHGGLSQTHSTASPGRLKAEAAELAQEKVCPIYHNATDNQGVRAKVRLCARIACCRCTGGRSLQN